MKSTSQPQLAIRVFVFGCALAASAAAQGFEPPNSLPWPVLSQATGAPRTALGNVLGEYQKFSGPPYLHSGIDVRGVEGDPAIVVAAGNIWLTKNFDPTDGTCASRTDCRLYIKGTDNRYIYYYSHLRLNQEAQEMTSEVRAKIVQAALAGNSGSVAAGTDVAAGQVLSGIADFPGDNSWAHLHFSIVDSTQNYDVIDPLSALSRAGSPLINDDERPRFQPLPSDDTRNILFLRDATDTEVVPSGNCREVTGALDIVAFVKDSFFTTDPAPEPVPGDIDSIGVHEASYVVGRVGSGSPPPTKVRWNRFDSVPLRCAGAPGTMCPALGQSGFFSASINEPGGSGAIDLASNFANVLYSNARSCTGYNSATYPNCPGFSEPEAFGHMLTHAYGIPGIWDTTALSDGLYQVSVEAFDQAGNGRAVTEFVTVNNNGPSPLPPEGAQPDAYIRDNDVDVGALPSTLGGEPFWASPDILIYPAGTPGITEISDPGFAQVEADVEYDLYVRISNDRCTAIDDIKVKLFFADPSAIITQADMQSITTEGTFVGDAKNPDGLDLVARSKGLLGPFVWKPTAAQAAGNNGHKCLIAQINADQDPIGATPDLIADDNNIAQRNIQVGAATSAFEIRNPQGAEADVGLDYSGDRFPTGHPASLVELSAQHHPALAVAWAGVPGTVLTHDTANNRLLLQFKVGRVRLPPARLPANIRIPASVRLVLPSSVLGTFRVHFAQSVNGAVRGGMSFQVSQSQIPT